LAKKFKKNNNINTENRKLKVAIVHHWLVSMGGGENVVEHFCELYPDADIFTNVYNKNKISGKISSHSIKKTFIHYLPFSFKLYKHFLPLMPLALWMLNLKKYDLIISSESGPSKGFRYNPKSIHVCYCHSPMRYLWDLDNSYMKSFNFIEKSIAKIIFPLLRKWDVYSAKNIDLIISNSNFVKNRIFKYWNKKSEVVHPSINVNDFFISNYKDYYLILSRHVYYKRIDIAIQAFNRLDKKLIIIGNGPETIKLKEIAKSNNIEFVGRVNDSDKKKYLSECKALIFPGIEDFGIVPIETMASGRPVIAFNKGGALDYVEENKNGVFFDSQSSDSLIDAIKNFEINIDNFDSKVIRESIDRFDNKYFNKQIKNKISQLY